MAVKEEQNMRNEEQEEKKKKRGQMRFDHGNGMLPMYTPGNFIHEIFCVFCVYDSLACVKENNNDVDDMCVALCVKNERRGRRSGRLGMKEEFFVLLLFLWHLSRSHRLLYDVHDV